MTQLRFSANLGFLWADLPLVDAIFAAKAAGFAAVECHWPYDTPANQVRAALQDSGLRMLGINTSRGSDLDFGLCACPDRTEEARKSIEQAVAYADAIEADAIHIMAGRAQGPKAEAAFLDNLKFAAGLTSRTLLIEPLNPVDVPGYFLASTDQAVDILSKVNAPHLKLMFDCYHVGRTEGDVIGRLRQLAPLIGHIQIASVPDRLSPDQGELDYDAVFDALTDLHWSRPIGAEYRPNGPTDASLAWLQRIQATSPR